MSNIPQSEQAVIASMQEVTSPSIDHLSTSSTSSIEESAETVLPSIKEETITETTPTISIQSFWESSKNVVVGSSEWEALSNQLPTEKQSYLQAYSHLYDAISQPLTSLNYNFSADSSALSELSSYLDKVSIEIEETVQHIYEEINMIEQNGDWEGDAFLTFKEKCLSYKEPLEQLALLIKTFSTIFSSLQEETETLSKNITETVLGNS